jgi:dienelactone hydrolase
VQHSISQTSFASNGSVTPAGMFRPAAARGALPAVIVIHGAWGADAHIRDVADRIAAAGYLALVPDLYADGNGRPAELAADRVGALKRLADSLPPGGLVDPEVRAHALATLPETERGRIEESLAAVRSTVDAPDPYVAQLRGAVAHLRDHPDCNGQIGALGFSMGGRLAGLLACGEPDLHAAVVFYGTPPPAGRPHRELAARPLRRQGHPHHRRRARVRRGHGARRQALRPPHLPRRAARVLQRHAAAVSRPRRPRRLGAHARIPRRAPRLSPHTIAVWWQTSTAERRS